MIRWNKYINLTRITDEQDVVSYHFADALELTRYIPVHRSMGAIDVGTGAGVPGIPLSIMYPHVPMMLIEVSQKKVQFLEHIITKLRLHRTRVIDYDWRTFLRKTTYTADLIMARASLQPDELIRAFRPSSAYRDATCVYWAAEHWNPSKKVSSYIRYTIPYDIAQRSRKYALLAREFT